MEDARAKEFYLSLDEQQKWAVRHFLRKVGQGDLADEMLKIEDYLHTRKKLLEFGVPIDNEHPYELFVKE